MTAAIFGLIGVLVGGVLNGLVAYTLERRRDFRSVIVSARLVRHELELIRGDFQHYVEDGHGLALPSLPIKHPAWDAHHRETLARMLPAPDWEMVSAGYTWVELHNNEPPNVGPDDEMTDDEREFYESVLTEMKGSLASLLPLVEGHRVGRHRHWQRWRYRRREV